MNSTLTGMGKLSSSLFCASLVLAGGSAVIGGQALALDEVGSEVFYQPEMGESAVQAELIFSNYKYDLKTPVTNISQSATKARVLYMTGIGEDLAVGAEIGYSTETINVSSLSLKSSGLTDITAWARGRYALESMTARYGLGLGFSPSKRLAPNSTTSKDGNAYSGGLSVLPYVGAEYNLTDIHIGAALEYAMPFERTSDDQATPSVESKITGGSVLTIKPYFDWDYEHGILGGYLGFSTIAESTSKTASGETKLGSSSFTSFGLRGHYKFNPGMMGLFGIESVAHNSRVINSSNSVNYSEMSLTLGARMLF